jgi:hypothetical protein
MRLRFSVAIALLVPVFSGCVGFGESVHVEAPQWKAGYSFSYVEKGSYAGAASVNGHSETEEDTYGPQTRVFEVLNTTLEADDDTVFLTAFTISDQNDKEQSLASDQKSGERSFVSNANIQFMGFRQRDLQEIYAWLRVDAECTNAGCAPRVTGLEFSDPPEWTLLDFPLTTGKRWSYTSDDVDLEEEFFGDLPIRFQAKVGGWKTVDTPLGKIKAVRVDWTFKPTDIDAYEERIKAEAREEGAKLTKFNIDLERSGTLYYSPEYQTTVQSTQRGTYLLEIQGSEDGQEFDLTARGRETHEAVLDGARLLPKTERGLDYIARLYFGKTGLNDPTGAGEALRYTLAVAADQTVVNAFEKESVSFTAKPDGVEQLPAGHKVSWRVVGYDGQSVANGEGLAFTHAFDAPGEYDVVAQAHDAKGNLTASGQVTIFANYIGTIPVECPDVMVTLVASTGTCPGIKLPVRDGIQYLKVRAEVASPLGAVPGLNQAQLVVSDPEGNEQMDPLREQGAYEVEVWWFYEYEVGATDWDAQVRHQRGVLEQVTYEVTLLYDEAPEFDWQWDFGVGTANALREWLRKG